MTLASPQVIARLADRFVLTWHNQAPDAFPPGAPHPDRPEPPTLPAGGGAGNVKVFFCTPAGEVVHFVQGFYRPATFLEEVALALELLELARGDDREAKLRAAHEERLRRSADLAPFATDVHVQGLLRVRARNHRLALACLLRDPKPFMVKDSYVCIR